MPFPGWNSIATTGILSNFFFWVSIGALVLLGVAEVLSHRFGERHDSLLAQQHQTEKYGTDSEIARLHRETAAANLARTKLEAQLSDRHLTAFQFEALQSLRGKVSSVIITSVGRTEAAKFAGEIALALKHAGINVEVGAQRIGYVWMNIYIVLPKPVPEYARDPLYVAFHNAGLSVGCGPRDLTPMGDLSLDVPVIMVGERPGLASNEIPFMAEVGAPPDKK